MIFGFKKNVRLRNKERTVDALALIGEEGMSDSFVIATCYMVAIRVILTLMAKGGADAAAGGYFS